MDVTVEDCVILNDGLNAWTNKVLLDLKSASAALEEIRELETSIRAISRPGERTPDRLAEDERFLESLQAIEEALDPVLEGPDIAAQNANEAFRRMCPREYMPPQAPKLTPDS